MISKYFAEIVLCRNESEKGYSKPVLYMNKTRCHKMVQNW